jgi:hypothetical protein
MSIRDREGCLLSEDVSAFRSSLYTLREIDALEDSCADRDALCEIGNWVRNYLAMPHRDLGRPGTVCPFVPEALELDTIWLTVAHTSRAEREQVEKVVAGGVELFLELEPRAGEASLFKALLILFPRIGEEEAADFIDAVQRKLKPLFVERGLMLGEFHRHNATPGLYNYAFNPLRSPVPMLAIRSMVESDLIFLMRDFDPPELRVRFLKAYLNRLETKLSHNRLKIATDALARAQAQLKG